MGIEMLDIEVCNVAKVSCQRCPATIIVSRWRDAQQYGWAVPSDGHLQLCPSCRTAHKRKLRENAVRLTPAKIVWIVTGKFLGLTDVREEFVDERAAESRLDEYRETVCDDDGWLPTDLGLAVKCETVAV